MVGILCFSGNRRGYVERRVFNGSIQGGGRAVCFWSYSYVVSSDFVRILSADSSSETDQRQKRLRYYLILWIIFRFLIPPVTDVSGLTTFQARIDSLGLDILVGNFGYFLLGYYLNTTDIKREARWCMYAMGVISLFLTPFLILHDCIKSGTYVERWFSPGSLNVLIMSAAIFLCFKYCRVFDHVKRPGIWEKLSGYTFFVYMFHMFVLEKLNLMGITTVSYPAVVSIPVMTVFIFIVSLMGAFVADHVPVVRKIVMLHSN